MDGNPTAVVCGGSLGEDDLDVTNLCYGFDRETDRWFWNCQWYVLCRFFL